MIKDAVAKTNATRKTRQAQKVADPDRPGGTAIERGGTIVGGAAPGTAAEEKCTAD